MATDLLDMTPPPSQHNGAHGLRCDAVSSGNGLNGQVFNIEEAASLLHRLGSHLRQAMALTMRLPVRSICRRETVAPSLLVHIHRVFTPRAKKQVSGVDTSGVVAVVADVQTRWTVTKVEMVGKAIRAIGVFLRRETAIALPVTSARPLPTGSSVPCAIGILVHLSPEALLNCGARLWAILAGHDDLHRCAVPGAGEDSAPAFLCPNYTMPIQERGV